MHDESKDQPGNDVRSERFLKVICTHNSDSDDPGDDSLGQAGRPAKPHAGRPQPNLRRTRL